VIQRTFCVEADLPCLASEIELIALRKLD